MGGVGRDVGGVKGGRTRSGRMGKVAEGDRQGIGGSGITRGGSGQL